MKHTQSTMNDNGSSVKMNYMEKEMVYKPPPSLMELNIFTTRTFATKNCCLMKNSMSYRSAVVNIGILCMKKFLKLEKSSRLK